MNRLQCINHTLLCTCFNGEEKLFDSITSFNRLCSSKAISQFCMSISAASFPHNALKLLSPLVHKALY
uniref:Eukaryotic translation initiation factor 3 subunit E eIF3e Eukaryotic translation initiation factor 3 subunit 6 n=1 Tax=Rhizophora mucronata TaxID=61149 RepID=A0A2P2LT68_RHIMU